MGTSFQDLKYKQCGFGNNVVRQTTRPIPMTTAEKWHFRLSIFYTIVAWNAGGIVLYMIFTGRGDWAKHYGFKEEDPRAPGEKFADLLGIKKAHVIRISKFRKVDEFDIDKTVPAENATEDSKSSAVNV